MGPAAYTIWKLYLRKRIQNYESKTRYKSEHFFELREDITTNSDVKKLEDTTNITKSQFDFPLAGSPKYQWPLHATLFKVKYYTGESEQKETMVYADCCYMSEANDFCKFYMSKDHVNTFLGPCQDLEKGPSK